MRIFLISFAICIFTPSSSFRREEKQKQEAKDRYWKVRSLLLYHVDLFKRVVKLHTQGKTDEAKSDLARLAKIRAEREAAQAKRKAEAEGKPVMHTSLFRT